MVTISTIITTCYTDDKLTITTISLANSAHYTHHKCIILHSAVLYLAISAMFYVVYRAKMIIIYTQLPCYSQYSLYQINTQSVKMIQST